MSGVALLNQVTVAGAGASFEAPARWSPASVAQFIITGVATVKLEGSLNGVNWVVIVSASASDAFADIPRFNHYRGNVTSISSGTATLLVAN